MDDRKRLLARTPNLAGRGTDYTNQPFNCRVYDRSAPPHSPDTPTPYWDTRSGNKRAICEDLPRLQVPGPGSGRLEEPLLFALGPKQ